tara:strand:+ start:228 stop:536 length:309 start_codon:yes stop_codon:yes gene_type:complete
MDLEEMKKKIENLEKHHHLQILKIIKASPMNHTINENKNGVFVNLAILPESTIDEIIKYLDYLNEQEDLLIDLESKKEDVKNTFFIEKEIKDNSLDLFSYQI